MQSEIGTFRLSSSIAMPRIEYPRRHLSRQDARDPRR
jgi:hypothetical protein